MTKDSHSDQKAPELITIRTFLSELDADLAKSTLQAAGIDCMFLRDDCGGMRPHLTMTQGIKLVVRAEDAAPAAEILDVEAPASE